MLTMLTLQMFSLKSNTSSLPAVSWRHHLHEFSVIVRAYSMDRFIRGVRVKTRKAVCEVNTSWVSVSTL